MSAINNGLTEGYRVRISLGTPVLYEIQQKNFNDRIVNVWNSLPNTVDFNALAVFKCTIKCMSTFLATLHSGVTNMSAQCACEQLHVSAPSCLAVLFNCYLILILSLERIK